MEDDLQKSDSCNQVSERKKVLASLNDSLACAFIDLGAFWSMGVHLPSAKSILPYFSSLSMVAVSVPFPEARNWKGTESGLIQGSTWWTGLNLYYFIQLSVWLTPSLTHENVSDLPHLTPLWKEMGQADVFKKVKDELQNWPIKPKAKKGKVSNVSNY